MKVKIREPPSQITLAFSCCCTTLMLWRTLNISATSPRFVPDEEVTQIKVCNQHWHLMVETAKFTLKKLKLIMTVSGSRNLTLLKAWLQLILEFPWWIRYWNSNLLYLDFRTSLLSAYVAYLPEFLKISLLESASRHMPTRSCVQSYYIENVKAPFSNLLLISLKKLLPIYWKRLQQSTSWKEFKEVQCYETPPGSKNSIGSIYYVEKSAHNWLWITSLLPWPHHRAWSRYGRFDQNGNPILFVVLCRRWWSPIEIIESCNANVNSFDIIYVKYDLTSEALTSKDHSSPSGSPCTHIEVKYFQKRKWCTTLSSYHITYTWAG